MTQSPSVTRPWETWVITRQQESESLRLQRARLKVVKGPDKGKQKDLESGGLVVGTSPESNLVLTDPAISWRHFEVVPTEKGYIVRDLGSKNGTKISGMYIREVLVTDGVNLEIGQSKIQFTLLKEHDEYQLSQKTSFGSLLGRSVMMRQVFAMLEPAATSDATVLLEGESGTGKDLAAENIHALSLRKTGPFVVVDCGTMQSTLAESELFGHKKGAFTGADHDRMGAIESAQGGTVFLDEIGELHPNIQPKLLRFLEKREIKRVGENHYRTVDVRLIAATNRDLKAEVEAGKFREDLFYRISVVRVRVPPLRERREDIALLARSFVQRLRPALDPTEVLSDQVLELLINYGWPGNVRELRNVIERLLLFPDRLDAIIQSSGEQTDPNMPPFVSLPFHEARKIWNERFEKLYLSAMLDSCNGVVAHAAQKSDIPRQTFHRLMNKHGLSR